MSCFTKPNEQDNQNLGRLIQTKDSQEQITQTKVPLCSSAKDEEEQKENDEIENILKFEHILQRSRIESFNENYQVNLYDCAKKVEEMINEIHLVTSSKHISQKKQKEIDLRKFGTISNILNIQFKSIIQILKSSDRKNEKVEQVQEIVIQEQAQELIQQEKLETKDNVFLVEEHKNNYPLKDEQQTTQQNTKDEFKSQAGGMLVSEEEHLLNYQDRKIDGTGGINRRYLCLVITIIIPYIDLCIECLHCLRSEVRQKRSTKSYMNDIKIYESKLNTISEFMPYALMIQQNDIFDCDIESDPTWQLLKQTSIEYVQIAPSVEIAKSLNGVHKAVMLGNAMAAKGAERTSAPGQFVQRYLSSLYYLCNPKTTHRKATIFFSQPDPKTAIQVWNLVDDTFVQHALKIVLPSMKYTKNIFVPRSKLQFTKETIISGIQAGNLNSITPQEQQNYISEAKQQQLQQNGNITKDQRNSLFKYTTGKVKVRVLCSTELKPPSDNQPNFKAVVLHIHGGGFVAMGSKSHQMYTRQWANILNLPVFSIDYAKAPEHPYPQALDDCFQVYQWILNQSNQYFNINPEKIIVVGDSAGGNLTTALTLLCIKYNIRVPHGVLALYPVLNLDLKAFTPSYFLALEDVILPHMFLKITLNAYLSDPDLKNYAGIDPFISPLVASDQVFKFINILSKINKQFQKQILSKFPPLRIQSGTNDPLSDHSYRFLHRLQALGNDVKLVVYNDMPHGYMNYDAPGGMKEANKCVLDAAETIKQLLARDH